MVVLHPLKVVITNLEDNLIMDLDAKKWPDAQTDDASSIYKVSVEFIELNTQALSSTSLIECALIDLQVIFLSAVLQLVPFSNVVYIERSDFRTKDSKDYYGLASSKSVLLRCASKFMLALL
ncbi:hypothetical protein IFM89_012502 [Coptis chinensis]|uniref:Uncharacterized protein n=1 Tax=Coptis chinensis TaxID=261450 RepID=A0A835I2T7_9MAGN|nr:hypothetical protein IFM89_012502 [Coptis chinensis]